MENWVQQKQAKIDFEGGDKSANPLTVHFYNHRTLYYVYPYTLRPLLSNDSIYENNIKRRRTVFLWQLHIDVGSALLLRNLDVIN